MAHECPECFDGCYCGGDIDDMLMNDTKEELRCTHCADGADLADLGDDSEETDNG